ncbi:hypothetical protein OIE66_40435 [Nonomuraea sp. NBC_01738]|uniref:hypothetical protein n=1 Tax=Nonomuraea sp. NBC_01738 TaxID=2976003 RepID=UPI002E127AA5|nr:hypothetical protein OIE66_40435 [Nonomuraea sp. NBC_01738]
MFGPLLIAHWLDLPVAVALSGAVMVGLSLDTAQSLAVCAVRRTVAWRRGVVVGYVLAAGAVAAALAL